MINSTNLKDPHAAHPTSLGSLGRSLWTNRVLIANLTKREVIGRYRGSVMGLAWSLFNPIFMLTVYAFVFSEIFKSRWGGMETGESKASFAILLFVGMIILALFSEVLNRAPALIVANTNYVTKVIFPLEILPVVSMCVALFHGMVSIGVMLVAIAVSSGGLHWTILWFPIVLLPFVILTTGLAWILSALGVFVRDVSQTVSIVTTILMFLSPVFYPITAVPERYKVVVLGSPLTFIIEQSRDVLIWGNSPSFSGLGTYFIVSIVFAWLGFAWFQKTRKGFADVL